VLELGKWKLAFYDYFMKFTKKAKINKARAELVTKAAGHVLEIGSGTGINFPLYNESVNKVDAIEPDERMIDKSRSRQNTAVVPIHLHQESAEYLPFPDKMFDTVISTLVFCTISDPIIALKEIQRVAKPGAMIYFLEHVKMPQPILAKTQDLMTPFWKKIAGGCHLNRDTLLQIETSGLRIKKVTRFYKGFMIQVSCANGQNS